MNVKHGDMDMKAWTCSMETGKWTMDMHGHATWTYSLVMERRRAAWACSMVMPHRHALCSIDIQLGHATWTFSISFWRAGCVVRVLRRRWGMWPFVVAWPHPFDVLHRKEELEWPCEADVFVVSWRFDRGFYPCEIGRTPWWLDWLTCPVWCVSKRESEARVCGCLDVTSTHVSSTVTFRPTWNVHCDTITLWHFNLLSCLNPLTTSHGFFIHLILFGWIVTSDISSTPFT